MSPDPSTKEETMSTTTPEDLLGPHGPALLTLPQVARVLGLTASAARTAAADGRLFNLPLVQAVPGGIRRVPTAAVRELIESWSRAEPAEQGTTPRTGVETCR